MIRKSIMVLAFKAYLTPSSQGNKFNIDHRDEPRGCNLKIFSDCCAYSSYFAIGSQIPRHKPLAIQSLVIPSVQPSYSLHVSSSPLHVLIDFL